MVGLETAAVIEKISYGIYWDNGVNICLVLAFSFKFKENRKSVFILKLF